MKRPCAIHPFDGNACVLSECEPGIAMSALDAGLAAEEEFCLDAAPEGVRIRVSRLCGCRKTLSRLCALGITPGTEIMLCGKNGSARRIQVRDSCVVLDGGCAEGILCVRASGCGSRWRRGWLGGRDNG